MGNADVINKELKDLIKIINSEVKFIREVILDLKKVEDLSDLVNFGIIEEYLIKYESNIKKIETINMSSEYNDNFISYIKEEKDKFLKFYLIHYNDESLKKNIDKIKNKEVSFKNIELKRVNSNYGGGRPPYNKDEEIAFKLIYLENDMSIFLEIFNNFINNICILKDFSEINTNVVIIGSNGSGKSTLSRRIKIDDINQSINIIPSHHILYLTSDDFIIPRYLNEKVDINTYQNETKLVTEEEPFDNNNFVNSLHNLINYLINNHNMQKGDTIKGNKGDTNLETTLKVCSELLKKKMVIHKNIICCCDNDNNKYDFNQMSDGERQVFYFVASVLANDKDGYIIVDEPENHLNSQICKLLWDKLEILKSNSTFVYITHDPKFAVSRTNSKIIWSKSFKYPNKWDYKVLETNEIPEELLIEVLGSKENIIFCEGENDSIDKQIYEAIFFDEKVIAVGGHLNVINYTKGINKITNLNIKAKGLIDRDGKTEDEIEKYRKTNIFVLPFNEIEMLLLSKEVLEKMNEVISVLNKEINIDDWQKSILEICNNKKEKILLDIVKSRVEILLSSKKLKNYKEIDELKSSYNEIFNSINLEEIYNEERLKLERIIKNKEYEELLKKCNLKNEILIGVPSREGYKNYHNEAVALIQNDNELKEILKKKYF